MNPHQPPPPQTQPGNSPPPPSHDLHPPHSLLKDRDYPKAVRRVTKAQAAGMSILGFFVLSLFITSTAIETRTSLDSQALTQSFPLDPDPLPSPSQDWIGRNIGLTPKPARFQSSANTLSINSYAANPDNQTNDRLSFFSRPVSGDSDALFIARLDQLDSTDENAQAGLMIRTSAHTGAPFASIFTTPSANHRLVTFRQLEGQNAQTDQSLIYRLQRLPQPTTYQTPLWLRLEKIGQRIKLYESPDGQSWRYVNATSLPPADSYQIGLFQSSGNLEIPAQSAFSHISLETSKTPKASKASPTTP